MPPDIVRRLNVEARTFVEAPATKRQFAAQSVLTMPADSATLTMFLARELSRWRALVETAQLREP